MSSIHVSKRPVVPPGQSLLKSFTRTHPRITPKRTTVSFDPSDSPGPDLNLPPSYSNQLNDAVKEDVSLTFRSLPPVKLSFKNTKTKFLKSPRDDEVSSRILRPHLTLKTHSPGHHVFTEGISRNSEIPRPPFALQHLKVPYSNLPDNIRIYKEKDRFAFGVKTSREEVVSQYKLTPKPKGLQVLDLPSGETFGDRLKELNLDIRGVKNITENPKKDTDIVNLTEIKSSVVRLDPTLAETESSCDTEAVKEASIKQSKEPLAPANSFFVTEDIKSTLNADNMKGTDKLKVPPGEGRLSVVSIGDTVSSNFIEHQNKKARQLYPLYDYRTKVKETYNKMKFKTNAQDIQPSRRPKPISDTFTYKISTRSFGYGNEDSATNIKPIRNNLQGRELSRASHFFEDSNDLDRSMREYFEPKLRKYYSKYSKRSQYRPRSVVSDDSSNMSPVPANPPPSEISHIHSEDMATHYNEPRTDMLTVHEERTQTAELAAAKAGGLSVIEMQVAEVLKETLSQERKVDVEAQGNSIQENDNDRGNVNDNETIITDTDILMEKVNENAYRMLDNSDELGGSVTERYVSVPDSEKTVDRQKDIFSLPTILTDSQKSLASRKLPQKINHTKQFLPVPTVSLDKLSHHPLLPNIKERTSLSRTLQNISVEEQKLGGSENEIESESTTDPDRLSLHIKDVKTTIPVKKLRLFSGSTHSSIRAPSVNVTDEFGAEHQLFYENYYGSAKESDQESKATLEKKLVTSSNIAFISPLKFEANAKRQ